MLVTQEVLDVVVELFTLFVEESKLEKDNGYEMNYTKKLIHRMILRISVSLLSRNVLLNSEYSSTSNSSYIITIFLHTIKEIINDLKKIKEMKTSAETQNTSIYIENGTPKFQKNNNRENKEFIDKNDDIQSYGNLSHLLNDFIFLNSIDLLLEFQTIFSVLFPSIGLQLIREKDKNDSHDENNGNSLKIENNGSGKIKNDKNNNDDKSNHNNNNRIDEKKKIMMEAITK